MALAIFDLDNTLIGGDSDHSFGEFLIYKGLVDPITFKQANDRFYQDYQAGTLDIFAYAEFALGPVAGKPLDELNALRQEFMASFIQPIELPKAHELVSHHKTAGDDLLVITATNRFVTEPIVKWLGIDELIATDPEMIDGVYTGKVTGTPSFQEGKVTRLNQWLENYHGDLTGAYFYSDSFNDLPLLKKVDNPVAVDPDDTLRKYANENNWPVVSLR
jgi:HAD superfamily hydrolase (TIGR01490 family)